MTQSPTPLHPVERGPELKDEVLRYLGLDPRNPVTVVLGLLARKYELDPLMNEVSVIRTSQGMKPYVTRDGLLQIAHRSGQLDGIVVDETHEGEHGWGATVSVWRKDMSHPFTYSAGCGRQESQAKQGNGPEMALARAERRALHRAFAVPSISGDVDDEPAAGESSSGSRSDSTVGQSHAPATGSVIGTGAAENRKEVVSTQYDDSAAPVSEHEQTAAVPPKNRFGQLDPDERHAVALHVSNGHAHAWKELSPLQRAAALRYLSDVDEGITSIEHLDDGRIVLQGPKDGRLFIRWVDVEHGLISEAVPLDDVVDVDTDL